VFNLSILILSVDLDFTNYDYYGDLLLFFIIQLKF